MMGSCRAFYAPWAAVLVLWLLLIPALRAEHKEKNERTSSAGESARNISVFVALDQQQLEQLADSSTDTNRHSLRALWAQDEDFWDITMNHECPVPCSFTTDPTQQQTADAVSELPPSQTTSGVLFSAQLFPAFGVFEEVWAAMHPRQTSILWTTEAAPTFRMGPQIPILRGMVDVLASYELDTDIPLVTFPSTLGTSAFTRHPVPRERRCDGDVPRRPEVVWVASNCDTTFNRRTEVGLPSLAASLARMSGFYVSAFLASGADDEGAWQYVAELMRHVAVHSYGRCLHNVNLPDGFESARTGHKFWRDKVKVLENYTFALVFENSDASHYVTEKLFQALAAGVIPIYMGAKNVDEFLPSPAAVIRVWDFDSPARLALYLQSIVCNQTALGSFHAWRDRPLPPSFLSLWDASWDTAKCRICRRLADAEFAQPRERIQRTAKAAMDAGFLAERGCEAEDAGAFPLALRYQRAAMRAAPRASRAKRDSRSALRRLAELELVAVAVSVAGASHTVQVPAAAHPPHPESLPAARHVHVHTVMRAVDSHCLTHRIAFGPPCQQLFMAVGMALEASNVYVPEQSPYKARSAQRQSESLCATLERLHRVRSNDTVEDAPVWRQADP